MSTTPEIPDLYIGYPDCAVCTDGGDMTYDEGFYCQTCKTLWREDGTHGELVE